MHTALFFVAGLSMICYTEVSEIMESSLGREPGKMAHGKVIVFVKVNGKLSFEVVGSLRDFSRSDSSVPSYLRSQR